MHGFFSPDDLARMRYMRENKTSLLEAPINPVITDRLYRQEAIRRVCEAFEVQKKRKALLVMATGTSKTHTACGTINNTLNLINYVVPKTIFTAIPQALFNRRTQGSLKKGSPENRGSSGSSPGS